MTHVDAFLLDAWDQNQLGGTGKRLPLEWLRRVPTEIEWWLAGGISAEWIPNILKESTPFGIDASSQLEISPGIKDLEKVNALIKAIRTFHED